MATNLGEEVRKAYWAAEVDRMAYADETTAASIIKSMAVGDEEKLLSEYNTGKALLLRGWRLSVGHKWSVRPEKETIISPDYPTIAVSAGHVANTPHFRSVTLIRKTK